MAEKKPSHQIRINSSMVKDLKDPAHANLKAVNIGLEDKDGNKQFGSLLIGKGAIVPDKHTAHLPVNQQKSYVNFVRENDYSIKLDGEPKAVKMSGADIIEQNRAYLKSKNKSCTAELESVGQEAEAPGAAMEQPDA